MSNNNYGRAIVAWSTANAPQLFTGECVRYEYDDQYSLADITGASGDVLAQIFSKAKAGISFEAKCSNASTNFLDLTGNAAQITVSGISSGTVLAEMVEEIWALDEPKVARVQATHYPDMTTGGTAAGTSGSAFTPDQSAGATQYPGGTFIYSTAGLAQAAGDIHYLRLTQRLRIAEHPATPAGKIVSATATGYKRQIEMRVLALGNPPAKGASISLTGIGMGSNYRVNRVTTMYAIERAMMYGIHAEWIPAFG